MTKYFPRPLTKKSSLAHFYNKVTVSRPLRTEGLTYVDSIIIFYSTCVQYSQENKNKTFHVKYYICFIYHVSSPITIFYVTIDSGLFDVVWSEPQNDSYNYFKNPDMTLDNTQM